MKTEFSNAEKVSSFYLQTQFDKVKQRLERYQNLVTWWIAKEYLTRLSTIHEAEELDNYERLKQIIHLEREWNEYLESKQFLFDVVLHLASDVSNEISDTHTLVWCLDIIDAINNRTPYHHVIETHFYPEEDILSFQKILSCFTKEDIVHLKEVMKEYYQLFFLRMISRKEKDIQGVVNLMQLMKEKDDHFQLAKEVNIRTIIFIMKKTKDYDELNKMVKDSFWKAYEKLYFETVSSCIAKSFFLAIQEAIHEDETLLLKKYFLDILLYIIDEKDNLDKLFVEDDGKEISVEDTDLPTLKKVTQEEVSSILAEPVLMNLDLSNVNLSSTSLNIFRMKNCNLKGNHTAKIFFSSDVKKIYYVRGVPMNFYDLTNSCFQGCRIMRLESLFPFTFSSQTFDEKVIKTYRMYLSDVSDTIREKYYRGIPLTKKEIIEVLQNNSSNMLKSRYQEIHQESNLLLLFQLNDLIPGIVQKIVTKQGGKD